LTVGVLVEISKVHRWLLPRELADTLDHLLVVVRPSAKADVVGIEACGK
jgi:hypothetical protein